MSLLFNRRAVLTVNTLRMSDLRIAFKCEKDTKPKPNKFTAKIYNLNPSHEKELAAMAPGGVPVLLEAGYKDATSQIFFGTLRLFFTAREGPDLVTTIETADGKAAFGTSRVSTSFAKGASNKAVLSAVALAVGVSPGNLNDAANKLSGASVFANGTVCFASADKEMTNICRSLGVEWSVQGGKLQILPIGKALEGKAIRLSEKTGMLGSPTIDHKGELTVRSLMQPDIFPGRLLVLEAERLKGQYRIEQTIHSGDTRSEDPWQVEIKAKKY